MLQDVIDSATSTSTKQRQDDFLPSSGKHLGVIHELGLQEDLSFDPGIVIDGDCNEKFCYKEDPFFTRRMSNFSSLEAFIFGDDRVLQFSKMQTGSISKPSNYDESSLSMLQPMSQSLDPPPNMFVDPPDQFNQLDFTGSTSAEFTNVCSYDLVLPRVKRMQDSSCTAFDPTDINAGIMFPDQMEIFSGNPSMVSDVMQDPDAEQPLICLGFFGAEDNPQFHGLGDMLPAEESAFKVVKLTAEEKREKIERYMRKRCARNFNKTIKYACRKSLADTRPRVRGRFAKNDENGDESTSSHNSPEDEADEEIPTMPGEKKRYNSGLGR